MTLNNIFPSPTLKSVLHSARRNAELIRQIPDRYTTSFVDNSRLSDQLRSQDRQSLLGNEFGRCPSALNHVFIVLFFSPAIKMIRFYTRRIVAMVKDTQTLRYGAIMQHPRKPMRRSVVEHSVAIRVASPCPDPTTARFENVRPKPPYLKAATTSGRAFGPFGTSGLFEKLSYGFKREADRAHLFVYDISSHCENLRHRFELWSGSLTAQTVCGPLCILPSNISSRRTMPCPEQQITL